MVSKVQHALEAPWRNLATAALVGVLACGLLIPVTAAARYAYPLGGDHGTMQGIDSVAAYYRAEAPAGSVIYHHELGWHYAFYLFDAPLHLVYIQTYQELTPALQREAAHAPGIRHYITIPAWRAVADVQRAMADSGWQLLERYRTYRADGTHSFTIYEIMP